MWGPVQDVQRGLRDHLRCIARLKERNFTGMGVIDGYYQRRTAPLMARPLRLCEMAAEADNADLQRCLLTTAFSSDMQIRACLGEILDNSHHDNLRFLNCSVCLASIIISMNGKCVFHRMLRNLNTIEKTNIDHSNYNVKFVY